MRKYTFPKKERLTGEKDIQELFHKGSSFYLFPFKVILLPEGEKPPATIRVLISVSRKTHRRAVDRNRIKRLVREAWRLNKSMLADMPPCRVGLLFTAKEILAPAEISLKMVHVLKKIRSTNRKNSGST